MVRRINRHNQQQPHPQPLSTAPVAKPLVMPHVKPETAEFTEVAAAVPTKPTGPLTLNELNKRSREIDRQHNELRRNAKKAADAAAKAELRGIAAFKRPRRLQKNLRAPVKP